MKIPASMPPSSAASTVSAPLPAQNPQSNSQAPELAELGIEAERVIKKVMERIIRNINGEPADLKDNAGWNEYAAEQRAERDATSSDAPQSISAIDEIPGPAERIAHLVAKHAAGGTAA